MSKHTPGPWTFVREGVRERDDMGGFFAGHEAVCDFGDGAQYYPTAGQPPNDADANLIAAAPDMLLALKAVVRQDYGAHGLADAAIAKAEGK